MGMMFVFGESTFSSSYRGVPADGNPRVSFEVALFPTFRTKGPALCLAQANGLGDVFSSSLGPKVRPFAKPRPKHIQTAGPFALQFTF